MSIDLSEWGELTVGTFDGRCVLTNNVAAFVTTVEHASAILTELRARDPQPTAIGRAFVFRSQAVDVGGADTIDSVRRERIVRLVTMGRSNGRRSAALRDDIVAALSSLSSALDVRRVIVIGGDHVLDARLLAPLRGMGAVSVTCEAPDHPHSAVVFDDGTVSLAVATLALHRNHRVDVLGRFELTGAGAP